MSCLFTQVPQASLVNEPAETGELLCYYEYENYSFIDTRPSKGIYIKLRAGDIS
jgi:hypothetical protein